MSPNPTPPDARPPLTDPDPHVKPRAYITSDIPPIGGVLKQRDEDFFVEEIPLYEPCGEGEHQYLFVEKQGMSTLELVRLLANHFKVRREAIGFAGLKDKRAITRQVISVQTPGKTPEDFPMLDHPRARVLWADLHTNKLRRGHLVGNRFSIRARGVEPGRVVYAQRALSILEQEGVPNRFGVQRFGYLRNNHLIGRALVLGEHQLACDLLLGEHERSPASQRDARMLYTEGDPGGALDLFPYGYRAEQSVLRALSKGRPPEQALRTMDATVRSFYISALQSAVFNNVLDRRLEAGTMGRLLPGDVAFIHADRSDRPITEADLDADEGRDLESRLAAFEICPSGPMWGARMTRAQGAPGDDEIDALHALGMTPEDFARADRSLGEMLDGARRPLRVRLKDPEVEAGVDEHGTYIRCTFELPRGAFATTVMDEVLKGEAARGHV